MKRLLKLIAFLSAVLLLLVVGTGGYLAQRYVHPPQRQAFVNGHILTMDQQNNVAEAVVIEKDRIVAVGARSEIQALIDSNTEVHDLQGKTLMPGIVDAHSHFPGTGLRVVAVDVSSPPVGDSRSIADVLQRLRAKAAHTAPGQWVFAYGFDEGLMAEHRYPHRLELDAVSKEHPIFIMHVSGHGGVANSAALALVGLSKDSPDPTNGLIGRDANTRELSGYVFEGPSDALRHLATTFSTRDALRILANASEEYVSVGVTTAQNGYLTAQYAKSLIPLARANLLPMRLLVWPDTTLAEEVLAGQRDATDSPRLKWGAVKMAIDGSIQACTGFLREPYYKCGDSQHRSSLISSPEEFRAKVSRLHAAGKQIAVHVNGDAAIDTWIDAFTHAQQEHPAKDPRAILVHAQTMRPDQIQRAVPLGMTPSFFPAHVYYWGDRHREEFLGPERAQRISPLATAQQNGLRFSIHLDSPVVPMNPWLLAWSAVQRETESGKALGTQERISPLQALRAMTIDAAWQNFLDKDLGSIEVGKYADLIVLSQNPLADPSALRSIRVLQTVVGGVTVHRADSAK